MNVELGGIIPGINLLLILTAAIYGIQLVKVSVRQFLELLHEMHEGLMNQQTRLIKLEAEHEALKGEVARLRNGR